MPSSDRARIQALTPKCCVGRSSTWSAGRSKSVRLNEVGDLAMTIDLPHSGDSIIRRDNLPVLSIDGRLAQRLAQRVLDCPSASGGRGGFTLGWRSQIQASPADRD